MTSDDRPVDHTVAWSHTVTLEPEPISAVKARAFVSHCLTEHRRFELIDPIRLVTSELVTNAILHAQTSITVTLALSDRGVLLTVTDSSPVVPRAMPFDAMSVGGRGLVLVDILSTDSGVLTDPTTGSKAVWASFLPRGAAQDVKEPPDTQAARRADD